MMRLPAFQTEPVPLTVTPLLLPPSCELITLESLKTAPPLMTSN